MGILEMVEATLPADCYVYKHSTACPVSSHTGRFIREVELDLPVYWVNVIEQRPLSNWIAQHYEVRHESPQLLRIRAGQAVKSWSHYDISPENLAAPV